ncbi:ABC transporter permease [Devosia nitrariae]|uniref:Peptide ABC transporter permease n=1 Tax=Devosia nitrariae TaxID=2071872 RepID=A0ABQ5W530_9HYPH|nr:ABC transporter permease [Devosia nitrariae]GLQ55172.1 peptide ABC transporter permease [Devosia nitrariae]
MIDQADIDTPATAPKAHAEVEHREQYAGQWTLIWWKLGRNKVALFSGAVVLIIYLVAIFADFLAPFSSEHYQGRYAYAPPQPLSFFVQNEEGWRFQPHVNAYTTDIDPVSFRRTFVPDPEEVVPVRFFAAGETYHLLGIIPTDIHLLGPENPRDPMFLFGADRLGRDVLSRTIHGTRVSMSIGLIGVGLSLVLGIILGGLSGFIGGAVDTLIQRIIEFLQSIPTIPLWMGLAAAIPQSWTPLQVYFAITVILSLIGWTSLAREVRGKFMALRHEDFVTAARLDGLGEMVIIRKHLVPSFLSHIIASVTLAIPAMILAETALSFIGIGLKPPVVSWGVLLQEAQNIRSVATAPWLFLPGAAIVVSVLSMNFLGDGLIDAADPYGN